MSDLRNRSGATLALPLLGALLLAGCGGGQPETLPDGPLVEGEGPGFDANNTPLLPGEDRGTLQRAELDQVLLAGPQAFLSRLRVTPALAGDKFVGFRLEELFPGDARFAGVELHPGDIVTHVNGLPIEQPDHFMKVWEQLKVAHELRIEYLRGAAVHVLRWQIADSRALPAKLVP